MKKNRHYRNALHHFGPVMHVNRRLDISQTVAGTGLKEGTLVKGQGGLL